MISIQTQTDLQDENIYCSMIHGGLDLTVNGKNHGSVSPCCLFRSQEKIFADVTVNFWKNSKFRGLREQNLKNVWASGCSNCRTLENAGKKSMRQGMNHGLGIQGQTDLPGPSRIDLQFDIGCNLACRTCGPTKSTFWQKHLIENGLQDTPVAISNSANLVIDVLSKLDLSGLRQLVFCGGETLLGQAYWTVAEWLATRVHNAKDQLTLCFQTNGTQPINKKNYETIEKFRLVKLHVSIDGTGSRFEYLRWPAHWDQTIKNILHIKDTCPGNVMFVIEETVSIFNVLYLDEVQDWVAKNFSTNREGDLTDHTKHLAKGIFSLKNFTTEYVQHLQQRPDLRGFVPKNWQEDPESIVAMLTEIKKFDSIRGQSFAQTFPEAAQMYKRFF